MTAAAFPFVPLLPDLPPSFSSGSGFTSELRWWMGLGAILGGLGHTGSAQRPHGGRSVQTGGGPPASPSPASSRVSNNWIYLGGFRLAGGFCAPGCTKSSTEPKCSRTLTPHSARAPRHAQGPAPSGNDHHDRHPARACPTAPGARRRAPGAGRQTPGARNCLRSATPIGAGSSLRS